MQRIVGAIALLLLFPFLTLVAAPGASAEDPLTVIELKSYGDSDLDLGTRACSSDSDLNPRLILRATLNASAPDGRWAVRVAVRRNGKTLDTKTSTDVWNHGKQLDISLPCPMIRTLVRNGFGSDTLPKFSFRIVRTSYRHNKVTTVVPGRVSVTAGHRQLTRVKPWKVRYTDDTLTTYRFGGTVQRWVKTAKGYMWINWRQTGTKVYAVYGDICEPAMVMLRTDAKGSFAVNLAKATVEEDGQKLVYLGIDSTATTAVFRRYFRAQDTTWQRGVRHGGC